MKKKILLFVSLIVILGLLTACASKATSEGYQEMPAAAPAMDALRNSGISGAVPMEQAAVGSTVTEADKTLSGGGETGSVERIILKNADLSIVVPDPAASMDRIAAMTDRMGGFVVSSNLYKTTTDMGLEVPYAYITIRVPAEKLTTALDEIKGQVEDPDSDVLSESISGQDVTAEYTDLKSRLTNLELAEKQLQNILESTTKTEDWLAVFTQLTATRSQIEVLKGQIKYYDESSSFSSISINLQAQAAVKPITVGKWEPKGVALEAIQRLIKTMRKIYEGLLKFILYTLPILLTYIILIGGPIWFFIWFIRRIVRHFKKGEAVAKKK
jgi:hypothetical protein